MEYLDLGHCIIFPFFATLVIFTAIKSLGKVRRGGGKKKAFRPSVRRSSKRTSDLFRAYVCQFSRYLIFLECESFCRHYFDQDKLSSGTTSY